MLILLGEALRCGHPAYAENICIKPHPDLPVDRWVRQFLPYPAATASGSIEGCLTEGTVVYVAAGTSVALLAAKLELPMIVAAPENDFDMGSLSDLEHVPFVRTAEELAEALRRPTACTLPEGYFFLEKDMPRWHRLVLGNGTVEEGIIGSR